MMHNKNIYKKLCTATISLGLLFSIGQFAYAHNPNLYDAEELAASNPTIENLTHLRALYAMDMLQHYANGENDEAKEAEQKLQKTQAQINSILDPAKYEDNLKYQIEAAEESANRLALFIEKSKLTDRTAEQYETLAQRYDALAELAKPHTKYSEKAIEYQIKAAEAKAKQADLTISESRRSNRTAKQYETLAQRYDALAELAKSHQTYSQNVLEYQIKAAKAIAMQFHIIGRIGRHNTTAEQYEALAQRWDAVVELAKSHQTYSQNVLEYQINAAEARLGQQHRIISRNGRTPGNHETLVQLYYELSQLYNLDRKYAKAARYKFSAIDTMLSMVDLTKDFNEKRNAYERAIAYNDDTVAVAEKSRWPHDSVVNFKIAAARSRIRLSQTILEHNKPTLQNYNNWVQCCEELVQLFDKNIDVFGRMDAAEARIDAAIARAKRAQFIAEQHETVENYDMLMKCWNEVAELSEIFINESLRYSFHQYEVIEEARRKAELAMEKRNFAAMIRQSTFLSIAALLGKK